MAELTKPTTLPRFADGVDAQVIEPTTGKKDIGWKAEKPAHQIMNWIHKFTYLWLQWASEKIDKMIGSNADTTLTIASGVIVPTQGNHKFDNEGGLKHDTLTNIDITNLDEGRLLVIRPGTENRRTVVQHNAGGAGSIITRSGADLELQRLRDQLILKRLGDNWIEVARTPAREYTHGRSSYVPLAQYAMQIPRHKTNGGKFTGLGVSNLSVTAFDGDFIWTHNGMVDLFKFDPRDAFPSGWPNPGVEQFTIPWPDTTGQGYGICWDGTKIYVAGINNGATNYGVLFEFDTINLTWNTLLTLGTGYKIKHLCFDGDHLWATAYDALGIGHHIMQIDPNTGAVLNTYSTATWGPCEKIIFDGVYIWVAAQGSYNVLRFDRVGLGFTAIALTKACSGIAYDGAYIWALEESLLATGAAVKIDPVSATIINSIAVERPRDICFDGTHVWSIGLLSTHGVTKIDPVAETAVVIALPGRTSSNGNVVVFDGTNVWVHDGQDWYRMNAR